MRQVRFMLPVAPRTKKTSNRIVSFGKPCYACKKRPYQKVLPSEAYEEMERQCQQVFPLLRSRLKDAGIMLPINVPVSIRALFYLESLRVGDSAGYYQAIGDILQTVGVISDDKLIEDWNDSKRLVDMDRPRVEVTITMLESGLFDGVKE